MDFGQTDIHSVFMFAFIILSLPIQGTLQEEVSYRQQLCWSELDVVDKHFKDPRFLNFLTTKEQTTKVLSANFQKMLSLNYITLRINRLESKQCRS